MTSVRPSFVSFVPNSRIITSKTRFSWKITAVGWCCACYLMTLLITQHRWPINEREWRASAMIMTREKWTRMALYVYHKTEARSRSHCCRGKARSIKYVEWVSTFLHVLCTELYRHLWPVWVYHIFPRYLIKWKNISWTQYYWNGPSRCVPSTIYCISTANTEHMQGPDVSVQLGYIWRL